MSGFDWGDIELLDVWDAEPRMAPEQVARRLYDLRQQVDLLVGRATPDYDDLDRAHRDEAVSIGSVLVYWIAHREPDNPALTAQRIHEYRRLNGPVGRIPPWDDLPPDFQQLAIDLMTLIIEWLEREGPR